MEHVTAASMLGLVFLVGWGLRGVWDRRGAPTVSEKARRAAINREILGRSSRGMW